MLSQQEFEDRLRAADPRARIARPALIRRVIRRQGDHGLLSFRVPHSDVRVISRDALLETLEPGTLEALDDLPETVILIREVDQELMQRPVGEVLREYWRRLLHARIHLAMEQPGPGSLTAEALEDRVRRIGVPAFNEASAVLRQEHLLAPGASPRQIYVEFVSAYLELYHFARPLLPRYFSLIEDYGDVLAMIREDLDDEALVRSCRPEGAAPPEPRIEKEDDEAEAEFRSRYEDLLRLATFDADRGNVVGAAIRYTEAARIATPALTKRAEGEALEHLRLLAERLAGPLRLSGVQVDEWQAALAELLDKVSEGHLPVEARLLFELQKICVEYEQPSRAFTPIRWAMSLGREPILRRQPLRRLATQIARLRKAIRQLHAVRLGDEERQRLYELFADARDRAEARMVRACEPRIHDALDGAGLTPSVVVEQNARRKLVAEMTDKLMRRGFLTMGDVRDAIAGNDLKLPDSRGSANVLLRVDSRLPRRLEGVYLRGESYMRLLHFAVGVVFGHGVGRWLSRHIAFPFGVAFSAIFMLDHIFAPVQLFFAREPQTRLHDAGLTHPPHVFHVIELNHYEWSIVVVLSLGFFTLGLLNSERFRLGVWSYMKWFGRGVDWAFGVIARLADIRWIEQMLKSAIARGVLNWVVRPGLWAALVTGILSFTPVSHLEALVYACGAFVIRFVLLNSRLGQRVENEVADFVYSSSWQLLVEIPYRMLRAVVNAFNAMLAQFERFRYMVDEMLRFRRGDPRVRVVGKAIGWFIWTPVYWLLRFVFVVFVEPTINPLKHFPAVTIAGKAIIPVVPALIREQMYWLSPLGPMAHAIAWTNVFMLPGLAGFLVWEFGRNWQLYEANRPGRLKPASVGHHGESIKGLLMPGWWGGTLPRLYTRLRRAERFAQRSGSWRHSRQHRQEVHEIEQAVDHFVDRETVAVLAPWPLRVGRTTARANRIEVELAWPGRESMQITFEAEGDQLVASIERAGWSAGLGETERRRLHNALAGLYKLADVDVVREQLLDTLRKQVSPDIAFARFDQGQLRIWAWRGKPPLIYHTTPRRVWTTRDSSGRDWPDLEKTDVAMSWQPVAWPDWVACWESDTPERLLGDWRLLPVPQARASNHAPGATDSATSDAAATA